MSSTSPSSGSPRYQQPELPTQVATLPPPQPTYIFRGHSAHIHGVHFLRQNSRLLTGDADGWVVLWNLSTKRAVAVWRAHDGATLGLGDWAEDKIITHGRDASLKVWQLRTQDEATFSTVLPVDDPVTHRQNPWLLHSLSVNTLNFCSFSSCKQQRSELTPIDEVDDLPEPLVIAVPGTKDSQVDVFQLPSERRVSTVPEVKSTKTGMVMAINILYRHGLLAVTGYESGHAAVHMHSPSDNTWQLLYLCDAHTQPILSLDAFPDLKCFLTSSADAVIGKHPLIESPKTQSGERSADGPLKAVNTGHAGQQSLRVRNDSKIYATAGWDGRVRVYSTKTMKELAVLKWHKEGIYAVAFANIDVPPHTAASAPVEDGVTVASTTQSLTHAAGSISQRRDAKARTTHWLAAGSKDGKVSLWDIY